jgi:hypothetical protein
MLKRIACVAVVVAASAASVADEGRIPLYEPTTITDPGSYVVTNDIAATSGPAIRVEALDVTIDLNGHTVTGDIVTAPTLGEHHLWLKNGLVTGQVAKVYSVAAPLVPSDPMRLRLSNVTVLLTVSFDPCWAIDVRDSRLGGLSVNGNTAPVQAHISDSTMGSLTMGSFRNAVIRGNSISGDLALNQGDLSSSGNFVEANTVGGHLRLNLGGTPGSIRNFVHDNVAGYIDVGTDGNDISGNSVRAGTITVSGSRNAIEGNSVEGTGFSLVLTGSNNLYRNNVLHNVSGPVQDNGTGNVDAGGNVH